MRAHWFQHVPFEGLGSIERWLLSNGYEISCTAFYESPDTPEASSIDFLVVMGGPMSLNDEITYPWLATEKDFIRRFIASGKPVLGICLGAQLIANALGARVYPNSVKEIGWLPVYSVPTDSDKCFEFPASTTVFHWHGETFDPPSGAIRLAKSEGCENQAFQYSEKVIGLQFHLETTPAAATAIIENCRHELVPSETVQSEEYILRSGEQHFRNVNALMDQILVYLS